MARRNWQDLIKDDLVVEVKENNDTTTNNVFQEKIDFNLIRNRDYKSKDFLKTELKNSFSELYNSNHSNEFFSKEKEQEIIKSHIQSFKSKGLTDSLFEIKWRSFDPDVIVDFLCASAEMMSGIEFFEYQMKFTRRVFRSIIYREGAEIVGLWSRQSGKTQTMTVIIATLCTLMPKLAILFQELKEFSRGFFAGIFAPTEKQAKITYNRIKSLTKSEYYKSFISNPEIGIDVLSEGLKWSNGSLVFYGSAKMSSNIEGDTGHLIYIDEAQDIDSDVFSYKIDPMRAFTNGTLVMTGLPSNSEFFKSKYDDAKILSSFLKEERKTLFEYDYKQVSKFNPYYEIFAKKQIKSKGEDSVFFRRNFLLDWSSVYGAEKKADIDKFIKNCCKEYLNFGDYTGYKVIAGLDLAYTTTSVLTVAEIVETDRKNGDFLVKDFIFKVLEIHKFENRTTLDLMELVSEILSKYQNKYMFTFDNTGGGQYFVEYFKNRYTELSSFVRSLNFNKNIKTLLTSLFFDLVNAGKIYFPASSKARNLFVWQEFLKQLSKVQIVEHEKGFYFNSYSKGSSPDDFIDSFLLALNSYYEYTNYRTGHISYVNPDLKPNPYYQSGHSKFKYKFPYNRPEPQVNNNIDKTFSGIMKNDLKYNRFYKILKSAIENSP